MREIVHLQAGQCGNQIGAKVSYTILMMEWLVIEKFIIASCERVGVGIILLREGIKFSSTIIYHLVNYYGFSLNNKCKIIINQSE